MTLLDPSMTWGGHADLGYGRGQSGNEKATEQFFGTRIGADDFMKKPSLRLEVRSRIEQLLGKVCTTVASGRSARRTERSDRENERSEFQRRLTFRLCRSYITMS